MPCTMCNAHATRTHAYACGRRHCTSVALSSECLARPKTHLLQRSATPCPEHYPCLVILSLLDVIRSLKFKSYYYARRGPLSPTLATVRHQTVLSRNSRTEVDLSSCMPGTGSWGGCAAQVSPRASGKSALSQLHTAWGNTTSGS